MQAIFPWCVNSLSDETILTSSFLLASHPSATGSWPGTGDMHCTCGTQKFSLLVPGSRQGRRQSPRVVAVLATHALADTSRSSAMLQLVVLPFPVCQARAEEGKCWWWGPLLLCLSQHFQRLQQSLRYKCYSRLQALLFCLKSIFHPKP